MHQKTSCVALDQEGENVASDKYFSDNSWFDDREMVPLNKTDDACEAHINCRSEKRRRDEDKRRLNDIRPQLASRVYGDRPYNISNDLHCELRS